MVLPGLLPAFPGASKHGVCLLRCTDACHLLSQMPWGCSVTCFPRCFSSCHKTPTVLADWLLAQPGVSEGHCIGLVSSGIWLLWDSGLTFSKYSQRFPVTKVHFTDATVFIMIYIVSILINLLHYNINTTKESSNQYIQLFIFKDNIQIF